MTKGLFYSKYQTPEDRKLFLRIDRAVKELAEVHPDAIARLADQEANIDEMVSLHRKLERYHYDTLRDQYIKMVDIWMASPKRDAYLADKAKANEQNQEN